MAFAIFILFTPRPQIFAKSLQPELYPSGITFRPLEVHCECRRDNRRVAGVFITGLSGLCPDQCGGVLMAAQGFLLIATFLLVFMVLARPLGSGLARLINDIPLPGTTGVERVLFSALGVSDREMNWKQYLSAILGLNILGLAVLFLCCSVSTICRLIHSSCRGCRGIWRSIPPSALSRIPTGNLIAVKPR